MQLPDCGEGELVYMYIYIYIFTTNFGVHVYIQWRISKCLGPQSIVINNEVGLACKTNLSVFCLGVHYSKRVVL